MNRRKVLTALALAVPVALGALAWDWVRFPWPDLTDDDDTEVARG